MMNKVLVRTISGICFVLVMLEIFKMPTAGSDRILWPLLIICYGLVLLVLGFIHGKFSGILLLCFFIMIWSSDVGAFCTGSLLGQRAGSRKLAPKISPNKSWAGFWGGLVFTAAASLILNRTGLLPLPLVHSLGLAFLVHCAGVCGDLLESKLKRKCGVKDSGNLIPGHGGLLDRFDSSMVAIPVGTLYLMIFNLI